MQNISGASAQADSLMAKVEPNVVHLTGNANAIVAGMRHGQGAAGKLLTDKKVASDVTQTIANALQTRFHLNPKRLGAMPMGDHPPRRTGKQSWDGVCLVLVVEKRQ
jgi:hypothetical protein